MQQLIALVTGSTSLHQPHNAANEGHSTDQRTDHNRRHHPFVRATRRASVRPLALALTIGIALTSAAARLFGHAVRRTRCVEVIGLTDARAVVLIARTVHTGGR